MAPGKDYQTKRDFNESPEPEALVTGDVNPHRAEVGESFVIHQHHATRLHFDLRIEMLNGRTPVLVSWAVPKNLGRRIQGVFHLIQTSAEDDKWLVLLDADERPTREPLPRLDPMMPIDANDLPTGTDWSYEPCWTGERILVRADSETHLVGNGADKSETDLALIHRQIVATDAVLDGLILGSGFVAVDLLYMDGRSLVDRPLQERRSLLEEVIVSSRAIQVGLIERDSSALLKAVRSQGLTGMIAKSLSSKYLSGVSSQSWVRVRISESLV